jgi:hypothetical protein
MRNFFVEHPPLVNCIYVLYTYMKTIYTSRSFTDHISLHSSVFYLSVFIGLEGKSRVRARTVDFADFFLFPRGFYPYSLPISPAALVCSPRYRRYFLDFIMDYERQKILT